MKLLKPTYKMKHITETIDIIQENKYKIVLFDLNNTIIDYYTDNISKDIFNFIQELKNNNIILYIITNSFDKNIVQSVSQKLNIECINNAFKPFPFSIKKILKKEKISSKDAVLIGDHILTDVLASNLSNIHSILIEPINNKEKFHSKIVRKIEKIISK